MLLTKSFSQIFTCLPAWGISYGKYLLLHILPLIRWGNTSSAALMSPGAPSVVTEVGVLSPLFATSSRIQAKPPSKVPLPHWVAFLSLRICLLCETCTSWATLFIGILGLTLYNTKIFTFIMCIFFT